MVQGNVVKPNSKRVTFKKVTNKKWFGKDVENKSEFKQSGRNKCFKNTHGL